jgi:hypothetical protein
LSTPLYRIQLASRTVEASAPVLSVGTHSSCAIALRDPVLSEVHCRITWNGGAFVLEDLSSATGTYLNGLALETPMPLSVGDVIVVGVSRLRVEGLGTVEAPLLELSVEESAFHYVASGAGGAKRDADDWVRWEVGFGRLKGLRLAGFAAALVGALLLVTPWVRSGEKVVLSAGPLRASHAALFEGDPAVARAHFEALGHAPGKDELAQMLAVVGEHGCQACHESFAGTPVDKCARCHASRVDGRHPFLANPPPDVARADWKDDGCAWCHAEHRGADGMNGPGRPGSGEARETCAGCHDEEQKKAGLKHFWQRIESGESGPQAEMAEFVVRSPDFSHRAHLTAKLACEDCHVPASSEGGEYAPVGFAQCMRCHAEGREVEARMAPKLRARVEQHGTGEHPELCSGCHAQPRSPDLRTVTLARETLAYEIPFRPHGDLFDARQKDCRRCHLDGVASKSPESEARVFQHGLHLSRLAATPAEGTEASKECLTCHTDIAGAEGFAQEKRALFRDLEATCGQCHKKKNDKDGKEEPLPVEAIRTGEGSSVTRVAFSHRAHASVPGNCYVCHVFEAADDLRAARPITRPEAADCSGCHKTSHDKLGGGECAKCHRSTLGALPVAFAGDLPKRYRVKAGSFSHFRKGHKKMTDSGNCLLCHDGIEKADTIEQIKILGDSSLMCVRCHVEQGGQFHFPLPSR